MQEQKNYQKYCCKQSIIFPWHGVICDGHIPHLFLSCRTTGWIVADVNPIVLGSFVCQVVWSKWKLLSAGSLQGPNIYPLLNKFYTNRLSVNQRICKFMLVLPCKGRQLKCEMLCIIQTIDMNISLLILRLNLINNKNFNIMNHSISQFWVKNLLCHMQTI